MLVALSSVGVGIGVTGAASGVDHARRARRGIAWIALAAVNVAHPLGR